MTLPQSSINAGSYNQFPQLADFSYNCISYLMNNNEDIWRMIYYPVPNAWDSTANSNLTHAQKASLIYDGSEDSSLFNVFMDDGQPDVQTKETTILKIYPMTAKGNNRVWGSTTMCFDTYVHYKINTLSNYRMRMVYITQQILATLNGVNIGGLGKLNFDMMWDTSSKMSESGVTPFKGMKLVMSTSIG